jgi:hypothetical protein
MNMTIKLREHVRYALLGSGAAEAAVALLSAAGAAVLVVLSGRPARLVVVAVVLGLQTARRLSAPTLRGRLVALATLPVVGLLAALIGAAFRADVALGDVLVVSALTASMALRRGPPTIARAGRTLGVAATVIFVAPAPAGHGAGDALAYLGAALVAGLCVVAVDTLLRPVQARHAETRALREVVDAARTGASDLHRLVQTVDHALAARGDGPDVRGLRQGLLALEVAAARGDRRAVDALLERIEAAAPGGRLPGQARPADAERPTPSTLRPSATTRTSLQLAAALGLALTIGQLVAPGHWAFAAVSVIALSSGLRSRGDVLLRTGERLGGALAGTALATLLSAALGGHQAASVAVILLLLAVGATLRERAYVLWAFCVTSMLSLLYGLEGEHGLDLLGQRLALNLVGAGCLVAVCFLLYPIPTGSIVRRRTADLVRSLNELLQTLGEPDALPEAARAVGERADALEAALRPSHVLARLRRRSGPRAHADAARAAAVAARALAADAVAGSPPPRGEVGALRRRLGAIGAALGGRDADPPPPLPKTAAGAPLDGALLRLQAALPAR